MSMERSRGRRKRSLRRSSHDDLSFLEGMDICILGNLHSAGRLSLFSIPTGTIWLCTNASNGAHSVSGKFTVS